MALNPLLEGIKDVCKQVITKCAFLVFFWKARNIMNNFPKHSTHFPEPTFCNLCFWEYPSYLCLVHHLIFNSKSQNHSYRNSELLTVYMVRSVENVCMCLHEQACYSNQPVDRGSEEEASYVQWCVSLCSVYLPI